MKLAGVEWSGVEWCGVVAEKIKIIYFSFLLYF